LLAERTPRELRLSPNVPAAAIPQPEIVLPVPGEAVAFGFRFLAISAQPQPDALIRASRPGDRVTLRYSSGPRKIKEVLERLKISAADRAHWPVVSWGGKILWMRGVQLEPDADWQLQVGPVPAP
jgi:tRNA(Ile)-lysidine synthase